MSSPGSFYSLADEPTNLAQVNERYPCGDRYQGAVYMGKKATKVKHGVGRYEFSNGSYYSGEWEHGSMHGKGTFWEATTGDRFDGLWNSGRRVCGVYYFHDGDVYVGGFDEATGHLKHGRAVIVEDMTPYDAVYKDDAVVKKTPFDTTANCRRVASSAQTRSNIHTKGESNEESVFDPSEQEMRKLQAAKSILRSRRDEVSLSASAVFSGAPAAGSQVRQFGLLQRGKSERFHHARPQDAKDAVRFYHR